MRGFLRSLLNSRSDREAIRAISAAWGEFDIVWQKGAWRAYRLSGTGPPITARTPWELSAAIREAWVATGAGGPR